MAAPGQGVTLYTLGHSRHAVEAFIDLARRHKIKLVVDVRGQPYSRFNPKYNREPFHDTLEINGINYCWYGDRLSGRPTLERYFFAEDLADLANTHPPKDTAIDLETHHRLLTHNLTRMIELTRLYGAELMLMTYFHFHGYRVNESILDVAYAHDVPVVNNTVHFHERIPPGLRGEYFFGAHPTTKGHAFIADNIIEVLEQSDRWVLDPGLAR